LKAHLLVALTFASSAFAAPLGLKTYRDLGLTVDETMLARSGTTAPALPQLTVPLSEKGATFKIQLDQNEVWSSYSKDSGTTWSEPRFVARAPSISAASVAKAPGKSLVVTITGTDGKTRDIRFKEDDICRLATAEDLKSAPEGAFVIDSVPPDNKDPRLLASRFCLGGSLAFEIGQPPKGYKIDAPLGLIVGDCMTGQAIHHAQSKTGTLYETRAVRTPAGDYLVMIPDGRHASSEQPNANILLAYRSSDGGKTWAGPSQPFGTTGKHHAALPLVPKGSKRIYVLETERQLPGQKAFGFRSSDNDGKTWSPVELIKLDSGQTFPGVGVIEPTETANRTWLIGFHHARILRGEFDAKGPRHWTVVSPPSGADELDELRIIALEGTNVLAIGRTNNGCLAEMRSSDDGRTWSAPQPTTLVNPDGPPMIFHLSDGKTLIALHHNRAILRSIDEPLHSDWLKMPSAKRTTRSLKDWVSRAEVWFSLSQDDGRTWSAPRFLFANAMAETLDGTNPDYQCSYVDLIADRRTIHLFLPHRWEEVVHLSFPEDKLGTFLTKEELKKALP